jgi:hypothetical protein
MNNQELLEKVSAIAKASALGPPDPDGADDDCSLNDYLQSLVDPDDPDPDSGSGHALHDSLMTGLSLAKAKIGILSGDHVKVHQALNKAMAFHSRLHTLRSRPLARATESFPVAGRDRVLPDECR